MHANYFTSPDEYEAALMPLLQRAIPERDLVRSAVKALVLKLYLTEAAAGALFNAGVTQPELAQAFDALIGELPEDPTPLAVMTRAMAYVVHTFPDVLMLKPSQQLDQAVGVAVVRIITEELYPLTGQTPDPDADARWAATELLTFRQLQAASLNALPVADRRTLADRLTAQLPLLTAVVAPAGLQAMRDVVDKAATLLRREPPVDVQQLNAAIALKA